MAVERPLISLQYSDLALEVGRAWEVYLLELVVGIKPNVYKREQNWKLYMSLLFFFDICMETFTRIEKFQEACKVLIPCTLGNGSDT